jgi:hypothetical protein
MTCDQAIELLPWYLNGTLEATERDEVRHHLATCEACRQALAETREAWQIFDQHLPSEALVALAWGEPPAGIDSTLAERHLAGCPQCATALELARTSRHLEEDDRIALFPAKPAVAPALETRGEGEPRTWRRAALAASLAAVVGLSGWIYSVRQAPGGTDFAANTPVLDLYSQDESTIERGSGEEAEAPAGAPVPIVLYPRAGAEEFERYEMHILDSEGDLILENRELTLQGEEDSVKSLSFRFSFPEPGTYEIQVFGLRDGRRGERVGMYEVTAR